MTTYGRSTGFCIDPIEKKPLNHFLPRSSVLSFGTAGCNLGCKFCQNWDISKSRQIERLSEEASPQQIAQAAVELGCRSVAFTYNDPVIWAEYAMDVARACRQVDIKTVAVTAGYITPAAREAFFRDIDAANVDLKGFTEHFYQHYTASHLQPVLDTLQWLKQETSVWLEITNLVIPQANDDEDQQRRMCDWLVEHVGPDTPVHFTAFHPDFRLQDRPPTPRETLLSCHERALACGLQHVYVGNVDDVQHQSTYCAHCSGLLIERNWYALGAYHLDGDRCAHCQARLVGRFEDRPGRWGRRRQAVRIADYAPAAIATGGDPAPNVAGSQRAGRAQAPAADAAPPDIPATKPPATAQRCDPFTSETDMASPSRSFIDSDSSELNLTEEQLAVIHRAACSALAQAVERGISGRDVRLGRGRSDSRRGSLRDGQASGTTAGLLRGAGTRRSSARPGPTSCSAHCAGGPAFSSAVGERIAVFRDNRFVVVSLCPSGRSAPERLASVEVGRHGLQIHDGGKSGLLLPTVATENGWEAEDFVRQTCRKAGLPHDAWRNPRAELITFETACWQAPFTAEILAPLHRRAEPDAVQLSNLAEHARVNLLAQYVGATPNYYAPGGWDGHVVGVGLTVHAGQGEPFRYAEFSMRPSVVLQATMVGLTEGAAKMLRQRVAAQLVQQAQVGLSVFLDPAMHGTAADCDLRGFDPQQRAILVLHRGHASVGFDRTGQASDILARTVAALRPSNLHAAAVYSLECRSTEDAFAFSSAPTASEGSRIRNPAVAGYFYPANQTELDRMVDQLLDFPPVTRHRWPAAMVPHAGLQYSGRVAADVLRRLQFPSTVICLGPKHTRLGVPWAIAPHEVWKLPNGKLLSDHDLAVNLAASIPGLELDAAAHAREHAIEVELPLIARLAPHSKVVGIAIGQADFEACQQLAQGLAQVLQDLPEPRYF